MLFGKPVYTRSTVRTQFEEKDADNWQTVLELVNFMLDEGGDEFVVLTLVDIKYNIRYVQSAPVDDNRFTVQLGIEEENGTRLVEKLCSEEDVVEIFREFFTTTNVKNINEYNEVEF